VPWELVTPSKASAQTLFGFARFLLFAFIKAFQDRHPPWYLCGFIRKPLCEIGVILSHDVEHRFLGELAGVSFS